MVQLTGAPVLWDVVVFCSSINSINCKRQIFGLCHYCMRWGTYTLNTFVRKVKRERLLWWRKCRWEEYIEVWIWREMHRIPLIQCWSNEGPFRRDWPKLCSRSRKNFLEHLRDTCPRRHNIMKLPHLQPRPRRLKLRIKRDVAKYENWPGGQILLPVNAKVSKVVVWDAVLSLNSPATIASLVVICSELMLLYTYFAILYTFPSLSYFHYY